VYANTPPQKKSKHATKNNGIISLTFCFKKTGTQNKSPDETNEQTNQECRMSGTKR